MEYIETTIVHWVKFIHHHFIGVIVASYVCAALLPQFGVTLAGMSMGSLALFNQTVDFRIPQMMLALLLFNAGLDVKTQDLHSVMKQPQMLAGGLLANVSLPLLYILLLSGMMRVWHDSEEVQQILTGLALVASMPIAGASTAWAQNANGNLALSLGLVLLTTLLSPLLSPLTLHSAGFVANGDYAEDLHELASGGVISFLGVWVMLPSLLGILAHRQMGADRIAQIKPYVKLTNYVVLILLNYANASLTLPRAFADPDLDFLIITLAIVITLCCLMFASGYWLSTIFQTDRHTRISLMFGLGMNNNGTGLVLASIALTDHPQVMLPIIFYNLTQHLIASRVDQRFSRNDPAD